MNSLRLSLIGTLITTSLLFSNCASQKTATSAAAPAGTPSVTANNEPAEHAELTGDWQYTMINNQQEEITGVLSIQRGGSAGYTGRITSSQIGQESETTITKAQLRGSEFIYEGVVKSPAGNIPFALTGTIRGDRMEGQNTVQYRGQELLYKVNATRR
jgi:hypothetical protein